MRLLYVMLALCDKPRIWLTFFRILAWPPSRKRYDAARLSASQK